MATVTYTPLQTITLSSTATSVTFASIPSTYRDLVLVVECSASSDTLARIQFNGDTTDGNYSFVYALGTGSSTASGSSSSYPFGSVNSSTTTNAIVHIMDYSATDKHKPCLDRDQESGQNVVFRAARWKNNDAITQVLVKPDTGSFSIDSSFSLYGILGEE